MQLNGLADVQIEPDDFLIQLMGSTHWVGLTCVRQLKFESCENSPALRTIQIKIALMEFVPPIAGQMPLTGLGHLFQILFPIF